MDISRSPAFRVMLVMCANFAVLGALVPYLPVWLSREKHLTGAEIGLILATANIARVVLGPLAAAWAEGLKDRRTPLLVFALVSLFGYITLAPLQGFVPILVIAFVAGLCFQGMVPFMEAAALRTTTSGALNYATVRGYSSVAFIVGNLVGGALLAAFGAWGPYAWIVGGCALLVASSLWLKSEPVIQAETQSFGARLRDGLNLLSEPRFILLSLGAGLIQASHGFYYGFASLVWLEEGVSRDIVGSVWALAVVFETVFLFLSARFLGRYSGAALIIAGGVGGIIRWTVYATSPSLAVILPMQALHALTFASTHIGSVRLIQAWYGDSRGTTAQTMFASIALAPLTGLAILASGPLYDYFKAGGFLTMSALALIGTGLAVTLRLSRHGKAGML